MMQILDLYFLEYLIKRIVILMLFNAGMQLIEFTEVVKDQQNLREFN